MSSRKPKIPILIPASGVRQDVNPMLRDGTMADIGENCIYYDGTIRPRPSMRKEINDPISGSAQLTPQYQMIYDAVDFSDPPPSGRHGVFIETSNGIMLLSRDSSGSYGPNTWDFKLSNSDIWHIDVAFDKVGGITPDWMYEINGYIIGKFRGAVYKAAISTLPSSLSWSLVVSGITGLNGNGGAYVHYQYDYENDVLFFCDTGVIWAIYDPTGTASKENLMPSGTAIPGTWNYTARRTGAGAKVGDWYIIPVADDTSAPANTYVDVRLHAYPCEWNGTDYDFDLDGWQEITIASNYGINLLGLPSPPGRTALGRSMFDAGINAKGNSVCVFNVARGGVELMATIELNASGFIQSSLTSQEVSNPFSTPSLADHAYVQTKDVFIAMYNARNLDPDNVPNDYEYRNMNILVSTDRGGTWMYFEGDTKYVKEKPASETYPNGEPMARFGIGGSTLDYMISINDSDKRYFITHFCSFDDWIPVNKNTYHNKVFLMPITQGGSFLGQLVNVYQADMADETNAIIIGTTHALARLNRETGEWDRITANDDEAADTGVTGVWSEDDDVPPLSVDSNDSSYVSGVTIEGSYGSNPWVFRTFEAQGETFLIGTNGQSYPIIYHPDMVEGRARRLGEVPGSNDPNWLPLADSPRGDLAPRARALCVAANRVMLLNDPGGNGYEVSVGGFNDPDRGWGTLDYQYVLLADTPGKIVCGNEISALQVAIYKEDAIYHAVAQTEFLGVSAPFRFEMSKAGIAGPCSPASVLRNFDGRQIYLARDGGVYMYDGVAPLDGGRNIRRLIQDQIDLNQLGKTWGVVDRKRKLVWFFYASRDNRVNKGLVISTDQGYPWPTWPVTLPDGWDFTCGIDAFLEDDITLGDLRTLDTYPDEATLDSFSTGRSEMLMGIKNGVFFRHQYDQTTDYTDDGVRIPIHLRTGWTTPPSQTLDVFSADDLYHIFSSPDPSMQIEVRLRAQQIGRNIRESKAQMLSSGKTQRRTRHRISGVQFAVDLRGSINNLFNWGGGRLGISKRGGR